jgi:hypothetical protein
LCEDHAKQEGGITSIDIMFITSFMQIRDAGAYLLGWLLNDDVSSIDRRMNNECGAVSETRIGRGNRSTRRKLSPEPLYPPQIPHKLNWDRTWATVVVSIYNSNLNTLFSSTIFTVTEYKMAEPYILPAELQLKEQW